MGFASKGYVNSKISAVDSKYAQLITSGTHRLGVWNASTNTPTLSPNSGNNGDWYDVSVEGDWDGRHWRIGDKIIFNSGISKWDQIPTGVEKDDTPMLIGFLTENSTFPTTRPSGKPLLIGDYLKVDSNANLPFEIDDGTGTMINFDSYQDEAEWNGTRFQEKSYQAGKTNEVGVKNPAVESPSGNANYQNEVNIEVVNKLKSIKEWEEVDTLNFEGNENTLYYLNKDYEERSYLKFTSQQDGSTIGYTITGSLPDIDINTSTDGINWTPWDGSNITLNNGEYRYIWNKSNTLTKNSDNNFNFRMTGSIAASGNCNSMINFSELSDYCFLYLFYDCTALTTPPELPSTTLVYGCYFMIFYNTSITTAPELPATILADSCYAGMFRDCTKLTSAPALQATNLVYGCYEGMFDNCVALTSAPVLPATTLAENCYANMFSNCTNLTIPPALPATTLADGCYRGMFSFCNSLATINLPATTLANTCYQMMFYKCNRLNNIKIEYTENFSESYFKYWVDGVSQSGTFYYNGSDTTRGKSAIPTGWTIQTF